jgi:hypothetical protein
MSEFGSEFGKVAVLMGGQARRGAAQRVVRERAADAHRCGGVGYGGVGR